MTDLFNPQPDYEDTYRQLHEQDWANTQRILRDRSEFGPWVECDSLLNKDQERLLRLVESSFGYLMTDETVVDRGTTEAGMLGTQPLQRQVSQLTVDSGFLAEVNMQFTLNTCLAHGWLEMVWNAQHGCKQLKLTHEGRWVLDCVDADRYWDEMDD